jgi:pyruvate dehydrogenase E2 component (dihydrolipoamide acetyltransferase)
MEEGNFVNWLKKDGEPVKSGEPLFSLENDKAVQEVEATDSGILRIPTDGPKPGQVVKVGEVIGHLLAENESPGTSVAPVSLSDAKPAEGSKPEARPEVTSKGPVSPDERTLQTKTGPAVSPRARRLAEQLGLDVTRLRGSGPGGRITEKDVRDAGK